MSKKQPKTLHTIISQMLQLPEDVVKSVIDKKEGNSKMSYKAIANVLKKEMGATLEAEDVKEIWMKSRELLNISTNELQELNDAIKDDKKYEFEDNHYIIYTTVNTKEGKKKERYKLPLEIVDNIFNDFSKHGANMSGMAVMQKYKLKPKAWNLIKNNIGLYKDSHIRSPMSMDIAAENGNIDEVIMDATFENFQDKYKNKYKEQHINVLEKDYKRIAKAWGTVEGFVEAIKPMLNSIKPIDIKAPKHKHTTDPVPVFHFGDTHLGKMYTDKVVARLDMLADDILSTKSKDVYINFMGDVFEALMQGGMHSGQIEGMDGIYGHDLFMYGVNVFVEFFKKILSTGKTIHFVGIGGNHDRSSKLNNEDNDRIFATIFYEMLKAYMQNAKMTFQIIRESVGTFEVDNIQYLVSHEGVHNKQPEKVAWKFADTGRQVVYTTAHVHNEQIYTGKNVTQLIVNALAGENEYDGRLGLHSYPGYSKTYRNEHGLPNIESKRLP